MKRVTTAVLLLLTGLAASGSRLHAQSSVVHASIPFDFVVSGKTMPAGVYTFTTPQRYVLRVQNRARTVSAFSALTPADTSRSEKPLLVFDKYGDRYYLHQVYAVEGLPISTLPTSRAERQAQQLHASLGPLQNPVRVTVAMGN